MKKIIYLFLIFIAVSCKPTLHSYIYDIDTKRPINAVSVYNMDALVIKTNVKGYFSLKDIYGRELTFKKENYKTKTVYSSSTQNGEFIDKSFNGDTIYMININSKYYNLYKDN